MDTLTHGFLGAVVVQLGLRQRIGRDATWAAAIAAMAPDLDIFIAPMLELVGMRDSFTTIRTHRAITHSLLVIPIYSLLLAFIWWLGRRKVRSGENGRRKIEALPAGEPARNPRPTPFWLLYLGVVIPMLTHPLLDFCTSYGTQLLSPASTHRYACDVVPIVDILYTPILALTVLTCYILRKATHSVAARSTFAVGLAGLLLSGGYLAGGKYMHDAAITHAEHVLAERKMVEPSRIEQADAYPAMGTIFLWRTVFETPDAWTVARVHYFARNDATMRAARAEKVENEWVRRARELPEYETFNWFTMGHSRATYTFDGKRHVVEFQDMRYGLTLDSLQSQWALRVVFGEDGELKEADMTRPRFGGRNIAAMWRDIWNP